MKGLRDGVGSTSQYNKRPSRSSLAEAESSAPPEVPRGGGGGEVAAGARSARKLTTSDALTYLNEVKKTFKDQNDIYVMFLDVMKDFKAQRIDTAAVIERVKALFKGHNNLIFGFNTFLPEGYEITAIEDDFVPPPRTAEFDEAISFVSKVKERYRDDDHVYKSFLDMLNSYRNGHKDINEVSQEVATLFDEHPDLVDEFTRFHL
ncbi:paired amphipathic helix protein Sin3-like 2 [Rutidosis leptorrhynchoides]|uniref:paired amphipathic helix protein Sin3-like 2 n=1 Tax=Rutidosis leptorrhynchoides TaxID=125765 RepID=UPI003A992D79